MPLTLAEKDDICPRRIRASHGNDGFHFEMLRQNINKKMLARMQLQSNAVLQTKRGIGHGRHNEQDLET